MKVLTCTSPGSFQYSEQPAPALTRDHAIIKIKRIGICGTDLHAFEGTQPYFNYPRILGHELSGELVDIDNAGGFKKGEIVTIIPYFNCGTCIACRSGKSNCCVNLKVFGVHIDGGMKEFISVPSYSLVHGNGLSLEALALIEPLAVGAHGVRRAGVQANEFVLVIGAGPIGLGVMEFAKIAGGNVIALDTNERRLQFCREKLNIKHAINATSGNVLELLKDITNGDMPTVVIDATGSQKAINNSFQYMAHGARYILVGLQKGDVTFSHPEFHKREGTLMSSRNATRTDFEQVIDALKTGKINPINYITHRVSFDDTAAKFESWLDVNNGVVKAMVEFRE
jgi:2-desacetyl-2-hydroxyethyl bacteriochlorophyllide A dehydrogenase